MTSEGARRYGVVLGAHGEVDAAATAALRRELAARRGPVKLFDRGFEDMDELKLRCLAETGLQPPRRPTFSKWAMKAAAAKA